ncbi:BQ5605_C001g00668 [Microbotryum silenes-dioicae]|uniref:BQ5605_C001g00668 protein n=1 Tax=Microbotryum silenes-dioicae TaxID=796604 RepID=A0A2X0M839_9BASI|nr:BQ5605_C001g00668 [Microbotryum silenes-dioicae]
MQITNQRTAGRRRLPEAPVSSIKSHSHNHEPRIGTTSYFASSQSTRSGFVRQAAHQRNAFTLRKLPPNQHRRLWVWIWWADFCHPPSKWDHAVKKTRENLERWATHVLFFPACHGIQLSVNGTLWRAPDGEMTTLSSVVSASNRHHAFLYPLIVPKGYQKIFAFPEQRCTSQVQQPASPKHTHVNNRSKSCVMCLTNAPESLANLPARSASLDRFFSGPSPRSFRGRMPGCLSLGGWTGRVTCSFFHLIWKLSRRGRFSSEPLVPITETAFEDVRASLELGVRVASYLCDNTQGVFRGYGWFCCGIDESYTIGLASVLSCISSDSSSDP